MALGTPYSFIWGSQGFEKSAKRVIAWHCYDCAINYIFKQIELDAQLMVS